MPAPVATYLLGTKIARETDYGTAPSALSTAWANGSGWYVGGKWFDVITDGAPKVVDTQGLIFPAGYGGRRAKNQQPPVVGRKWTEGTLSAPVVSDFLGLLLYGALGEASTNSVPSATASLLGTPASAAEPINTNPKSLVLVNQPSDGGAVLRFEVKGTGNAGTISVCGVDSYGNGASELISFASGGLFYSRTSFSAIGASGVAVSGITNGSLTITGFKNFSHLFTAASNSSGISLALEAHGDPAAGAASKSFIVPGLVVKELTLATPAEAKDGVLKADVSFEGQPTATSNATTLNNASALRLFPAWTLQVKRDNGTTYNVVTDHSLKITTAARNSFAATGAQGPATQFYGPGLEVTGDMTVLPTNEYEFNVWRGASQMQLHMNWNTPWKMTSTQNQQLQASAIVYVESRDVGESDGAQNVKLTLRSVDSGDFGPVKFQLINGVPSY